MTRQITKSTKQIFESGTCFTKKKKNTDDKKIWLHVVGDEYSCWEIVRERKKKQENRSKISTNEW